MNNVSAISDTHSSNASPTSSSSTLKQRNIEVIAPIVAILAFLVLAICILSNLIINLGACTSRM